MQTPKPLILHVAHCTAGFRRTLGTMAWVSSGSRARPRAGQAFRAALTILVNHSRARGGPVTLLFNLNGLRRPIFRALTTFLNHFSSLRPLTLIVYLNGRSYLNVNEGKGLLRLIVYLNGYS